MSNSQLTVMGQPMGRITAPSGGVRKYVADKAGIDLPVVPKGGKGLTFKEVKALALAEGVTDVELKAWGKEYDALRSKHFANSAIVIGALAADPAFRKSVRSSHNKAGDMVGFSATFRKEKSVTASGATRIAQLEAQLAEALKRIPAALPVA